MVISSMSILLPDQLRKLDSNLQSKINELTNCFHQLEKTSADLIQATIQKCPSSTQDAKSVMSGIERSDDIISEVATSSYFLHHLHQGELLLGIAPDCWILFKLQRE